MNEKQATRLVLFLIKAALMFGAMCLATAFGWALVSIRVIIPTDYFEDAQLHFMNNISQVYAIPVLIFAWLLSGACIFAVYNGTDHSYSDHYAAAMFTCLAIGVTFIALVVNP